MACALPAIAHADGITGGVAAFSGGTPPAAPPAPPVAPHGRATLLPNGLAIAPADAPPQVKAIIDAGNRIATLPYIYGGGHNATFSGRGYDCSGSVSYALHGGGLLSSPLDSSSFMRWGAHGRGSWITIYTNPGHAYMVVAGLRFDTSMRTPISAAARRSTTTARSSFTALSSRWSSRMRPSAGYVVRHPVGF